MIHFYIKRDGKEIILSRNILSKEGETTISKIMHQGTGFPVDNSFIDFNSPAVNFMYTVIQNIINKYIIPKYDIKDIRVEFPEWVL